MKAELKKIHKEALDRFEFEYEREKDQRKLSIEEMRFANVEGAQWEDDAKEKRKDRPMYEINRIGAVIDQLIGDQRQNRTAIKIRPVAGGSSEDNAEIYNGLIRNIEAQSKADNAYDCAYDEAVTGGYGAWRILTEFSDDDSIIRNQQDIKIKPIMSAASSVWFDSEATEYDKRDGKYCFVTSKIKLDSFKKKYPKASITDFSEDIYTKGQCKEWFTGEYVRIAEYWVKEPHTRTLALLSDDRVIDLDEEKDVIDELEGQGVTVVKQKQFKTFKVKMYTMNGAEILSGPNDWAGKYIPIVPVFGKISNIEGKTYVRGLVRPAKDVCRIYNYASSAAVEAAALSPKDPIWMTKKQAQGHETQLRTLNTRNPPVAFYNADGNAPPPGRTGSPSVQTALLSQIQQAATDIEAVTGIYAASLGNAPQLLSERSVQSQAEKGDRGAFVFQDNLEKSKQYTGDILIDLIPKIIDTPRIVRVLGVDGESEEMEINTPALDEFNQQIIDRQTGKQVIVNDLSMGKYEAIAETGAPFSTRKQESAQQLIDLSIGAPVIQELGLDLIIKNLGLIDGDVMTERLRKRMISQGVVEPTEEEIEELGLNQPQPEDPDAAVLRDNVAMQTTNLQSQVEKRDAETDNILIKTQGETIKAMKDLLDAFKAKQELGIPLGRTEKELLDSQDGIVEIAQDNLPVQ